MKKIWFDEAWDDYVYWQTQDRRTLKRNAVRAMREGYTLLRDIERDNFGGIAKPKPLTGDLSGF